VESVYDGNMQLRTLVVVIAVATSPAHGDDQAPYTPPDFMTKPPPLPSHLDASSAWRLSLADTLALAMRNNLDVVIEREQVAIQSLGVTVARGEFEPSVNAQYSHGSSVTPASGVTAIAAFGLMPYTLVSDNWNLAINDRLPTGAQVQVGLSNNRSAANVGDGVPPLFYSTSVFASITQPLLKSFSPDLDIPRIDILRAELGSERERAQLAIRAAAVAQTTENAYWDVAKALYHYDLETRSLQRAQDQLDLTKRQISAGLNPPSDLIAAQSTFAQRQLALVQAEQTIEQSWDHLRAAINLPRDQWSRPILPTDVPGFAPDRSTAEDALQVAIAHRPELVQYELDLKSELLAVRQAENNERPEIDLQVSGQLLGEQPTYWSALNEQFVTRDAPSYTVGVNVIWTPLLRAARAAAAQERARLHIAQISRDRGIQDVWAAVRDAVRALASAERSVYAAKKFRELAAQMLDLEQRRYLNGQSQIIVIAQRQEELATAQVAELDAVVAHREASTALLLATGRLLDARNVQLAVRK
jgi:outer membrane protein